MKHFRPAKGVVLVIFLNVTLLVSGHVSPVYAQLPAGGSVFSEPGSSAASTIFSNRNVYSAGSVVRPPATIEGDFVAAGGKVIIDQFVKGDAALAGASVNVRAPVGDDVRIAGGDVILESAVGGELFVAAANISLTRTARVANATSLFAGDVRIDGNIDGPLKVSARKIVLNGEVHGNARLFAEQIELGPMAKISGTLHYGVSGELRKAEGATVGGAIMRGRGTGAEGQDDAADEDSADAEQGWYRHTEMRGPAWLVSVVVFLSLLACVSVFLLLFPVFPGLAAARIGSAPLRTMAAGFAAVLGTPMLAGLLFITILGIPLGIGLLALYPVLLLAGYVVGLLFVSRRAQTAMGKPLPGSLVGAIGFFALTLLLVMLLARLPFVGPLVILLLTVAGAGACVLELFRRR